MSVDLKFVFPLSKQAYNFVSTPKRAYLSRFIDEIIMPNEMVSLNIVKREKMQKIIKNINESDFISLQYITNNYYNPKENV